MRLSRHLMARIAAQHGVVSIGQLLRDGQRRDGVRRLVGAGVLVTLHRGTYRLGTALDTFESRCVAACLAEPEAVITGRAAGRLWGFRHVAPPAEPIVALPHDRTTLGRGVTLRRTNLLLPDETVHRSDGIVVASPPRAWFDCARDVDDDRFEALTEFVIDNHAAVPTLWRTIRRLDVRGRPGLGRAKRVLSQRPTWQKPADSRLELRVIRALERRGLPTLTRQHAVRLPSGHVIHLDGALPEVRWGVEVDHVTWHGGRSDAQRDKTRDRQLRRLGWQIDRVTDHELRSDFRGVIDELVTMYRLRRNDHAA